MSAQSTHNSPEYDFGEILDAIIEPLLRMCEASVEKFSHIEQHIYIINCMHYIKVIYHILIIIINN